MSRGRRRKKKGPFGIPRLLKDGHEYIHDRASLECLYEELHLMYYLEYLGRDVDPLPLSGGGRVVHVTCGG